MALKGSNPHSRDELPFSVPVEHVIANMFGSSVRINGRGFLPGPHPHSPQTAADKDHPDRAAGDADAFLTENGGDLVPASHALLTLVDPHHVRVQHGVPHLRRRRNSWPQRAVERCP